jgi:PAS domain S-box-containing protein
MKPSLEDVLITDDLAHRPARSPNYAVENGALAGLAEALADSPQTIPQKMVETALEVCRADSAGISILEPGGEAGVFRWYAIAGRFAPNVGSHVLREASPSGIVLDRDTSLLFSYPERHFDYGMAIDPPIVEALLVPFHSEGKPVGTLWVIAHTPSRQFDAEDQRLLTSLSRFAAVVYQTRTALLTTDAGLKAKANEVRQMLDSFPTGITRCGRDLRYISANAAIGNLVGLSVEEIIGRRIVDVIGVEAFEVIRPYVDRVLRGERVEYEEEIPYAPGGMRFMHVVYTPWIDSEGHVTGWVASVSDITDLKRTTKALRTSEERLRLAMSSGTIGIWDWDVSSGQLTWSPELCEIFGVEAGAERTYEDFRSRVHPDDLAAVESDRDTAIHNRTQFDLEFRIVLPSGEIRWLSAKGRGHYDENGNVVRVVGNNIDITERVQAKEALRESKDREAFLLRLADTIRPLGDPLAIQEVTARLVGEHLHVNRVGYADIEGTDFITRLDYANGVAPFQGRGPVAIFGESLLETYRRGEPVAVNDVCRDPRLTESERAVLLANDIAAFAGEMLLKNKQWVAVFGVQNATPRAWTKPEVELMRDVAERVWEAVERARAEEALREREQRLQLALDASGAGSWMRDARTGHIDWDDRFRKLYGFTPEEPASLEAWLRRVHEEDRQQVVELVEQIRHAKTHDTFDSTFRIVRPDGTVSWIQSLGQAHRDAEGNLMQLTGIELDITGRRRNEEARHSTEARLRESLEVALRRTDSELRTILKAAPIGIVTMDREGTVTTWNDAAERIFGYSADEVIGRINPAIPDDAVAGFRESISRVLEGATIQIELPEIRKDGSVIHVSMVRAPHHDEHGTVKGIITLVEDITTKREAENDLARVRSALAEAQGEEARHIARELHDDIGQRLALLSFDIQGMASRPLSSHELVTNLHACQRQILDIGAGLRQISHRMHPSVLEDLGLSNALEHLCEDFSKREGIPVRFDSDELAIDVPRRIGACLYRVAQEAFRNISKHASAVDVEVELAVVGQGLQLSIVDSGTGFDTSAVKSGLGLHSMRERAELASGSFSVTSQPGSGTRIVISVPLHESYRRSTFSAGNDVVQPAEQMKHPAKKCRLLIGDDHPLFASGVAKLLEETHEVVGTVGDGLALVRAAEQMNPDLVLVDISMPVMNGFDAARKIRRSVPRAKLLFLSTYSSADYVDEAFKAGADGYLVKHAALSELPIAIAAVLEGRQYRSALIRKQSSSTA